MKTSRPWRKVVTTSQAELIGGRLLHIHHLECGHEVRRPPGRDTGRPMKIVQCEHCRTPMPPFKKIFLSEAILAQGVLNDWFAQENMDRRIGDVKPQRRAR